MGDLQKQVLTDGQRRWRRFAGIIATETRRIQISLEDRLGGMLEVFGLGRATGDPIQAELRQQLRGFAARRPVGAAARGRDVQAISRILEAQRQVAMRQNLIDFARRQREASIRAQQGPGEFVGGVREAIPEPVGGAFMRGMRSSGGARFIERARTGAEAFSRLLWGDLHNQRWNPPANFD
jgi:hypothetical protein